MPHQFTLPLHEVRKNHFSGGTSNPNSIPYTQTVNV
jgi:hypothetical protein